MARSLRPVMAEEAGPSEEKRTLTERVVDASVGERAHAVVQPAEAGGHEPTFAEMIETWIELAWQDGSLGWIGIANMPSTRQQCRLPARRRLQGGLRGARQPGDHGRPVLPQRSGRGHRATPTASPGHGISAREPATPSIVAAGFIPTVNGEMVTGDDGIPQLMVGLIPHDEVTFTDGWHVQGLKGTGSYDYNVTDHDGPEVADLPALRPLAEAGQERRLPPRPDPHHRRRPRLVGPRRLEEHARRRHRAGQDQGPDG